VCAADTYVRARIDRNAKRRASDALAAMGLSISDAIRLLMLRVADERRLPFDLRAPDGVGRGFVVEPDAENFDGGMDGGEPDESLLCVAEDISPTHESAEPGIDESENGVTEELRELGLAEDRSKSLKARVTARLRRAIVNAEFSLGQALSEEKLAAALGVGRTPVRAAITALQRQGLIDVQPQRGSFVFLPSEAEVAALCEFREVVEIQALSLSCLRRKEATLAKLRMICNDMDAAERRNDFLAVTRADGAFHSVFFENCGNHYLVESYELVSGQIAVLRVRTTFVVGVANEHRPIIDAIESNDLGRAKQILSKHALKVRRLYASALQSGQLSGAGPRKDHAQPPITLDLLDD